MYQATECTRREEELGAFGRGIQPSAPSPQLSDWRRKRRVNCRCQAEHRFDFAQ
jgi:hypothetical protein